MTRTAHYFDRIVLQGPPAYDLTHSLECRNNKDDQKRYLRRLNAYVDLLVYIDSIPGLAERIVFATKPREFYCPECFRERAGEFGLTALQSDSATAEIQNDLVENAKVVYSRDRSSYWVARVTHPLLGNTWVRRYPPKRRPPRRELMKNLFMAIGQPTLWDLIASAHYSLPLLDSYDAQWLNRDPQNEAQQVALHLCLPAMQGVKLETFIRMQQDDEPSYIRFQATIRKAIDEQLERTTAKGSSPAHVAEAVLTEYVRPELADIERKLKSAKSSFGKKLVASASIGTTVTSVGIFGTMPLVIATGVAAAATSVTQLYKYFDDRASVSMSDLHFLWKIDRVEHLTSSANASRRRQLRR